MQHIYALLVNLSLCAIKRYSLIVVGGNHIRKITNKNSTTIVIDATNILHARVPSSKTDSK